MPIEFFDDAVANLCDTFILKSAANLLIPLRVNSTLFSEWTLKSLRGLAASFHHTEVRILPPIAADDQRKARQWRAFAIYRPVSKLQISRLVGPNCRKSPDEYPNIPVFWGRPTQETGFDFHSLADAAVQLAKFSASAAGKLGMPGPHCRAGNVTGRAMSPVK